MKTKLRQNSGFAIISVVFLLLVLSLMGTAMYMYSVTSLRSVRFLSDRKKAEYLAQSGVEAASYAYQLAVSGGARNATASALVNTRDANGKPLDISSNVVYLVYDRSATENNHYKYVKSDAINSYSDDQIIGHYTVTITASTEKSVANILQEDSSSLSGVTAYPVEINESIREIEAVGKVGKEGQNGVSARKKAYLAEPVQALGTYYGDDGIIDGGITNKKKTINYTDESGTEKTKDVPIAKTAAFEVLGQYSTGSTLQIKISLFNNIPFIGKYIGIENSYPINLSSSTVPILMAYTTGNMIMGEPSAGTISFKKNQSNMVSFIGKKNLFVNTGIDVTPTKTNFNVMYLRGDTIVINGDIEIYVYGYMRSSSSLLSRLFGQGLTNMYNALAGNYCWSTVVIGTSNIETASEVDPVHTSVYTLAPTIESTGVTYPTTGGYGRCGKVFFGGNVFVNLQIPNVGTYRYKVFDAGDVYYYDDNLAQYQGGKEGYGIDLFKYFVDYSIATKRYSDNVLSRFAEVMGMYYSTTDQTPTTYAIGDDGGNLTYCAMRKIERNASGSFIFPQDTYKSLVPPDPTDGTALTWVLG